MSNQSDGDEQLEANAKSAFAAEIKPFLEQQERESKRRVELAIELKRLEQQIESLANPYFFDVATKAFDKYGAKAALEIRDAIDKSHLDFLIGSINFGAGQDSMLDLLREISVADLFVIFDGEKPACQFFPSVGVVVFAFTTQDRIEGFRVDNGVPVCLQSRMVRLRDIFDGPFEGRSFFTLHLNPKAGAFEIVVPKKLVGEICSQF